jgi:type I restriction enzyme R subunit
LSEIGIVGVLLDRLKELGWRESSLCPRYVRGSVFIDDLFKASFKRLNEKALNASGLNNKIDSVFDRVKDLLENAEPHVFLEYLRRGIDIEEDKKKVRVWLLDYDNVDNNDFTVCREAQFYGEHMDIRPDLILYVNGIPLVVVEAKDPSRLRERAVNEGISQLLRYEREFPKLFRYAQIGVAYTNEESSVYLPMMSDWRGRERWYGRWRDEKGNYNILDLLRRERLLEVIAWFTFYKGLDKKNKVVPRYMQYWATRKAMERIKAYLEGREGRNRGLIWHWQGSGKTYLMFYIAYQFYVRFIDRDPLIFFIIDRKELEKQLYEDFIKDIHAPYFREEVRVVESIDELRKILVDIKESEDKSSRIVRGVYVVLIQKFRPDELMGISEIKKRDILLLLDEAHRSQYGELAAAMRRILPNAVRMAFTGTPVMGYERNTFNIFAYPEHGELYLDKYFISDSIKDGYTLPIKYQVVQELGGVKINVFPSEIKDLLESWAKRAAELGSLDDISEEVEELAETGSGEIIVTKKEIRQKLNRIKVFLEDPARIEKIAEYIADRIREDTENFSFKAMVVVASRLACVRMKRALDKALAKRYGEEARGWSEVVMIYTNNDKEEIKSYLEELLERWRGSMEHAVKDWHEINSRIQDDFKEKDDPRILIVTDMLITGFDCPRLKVMYLDKPLYEHRLLQAIARVNRPYESGGIRKEFGQVVDFVGLLDHVKETIRRYELLDQDIYREIYEESINSIDKGLDELKQLIDEVNSRLSAGITVGAHKVILDINRIVGLLRAVSTEDSKQAVQLLEDASKILAMGYRLSEYNVLDILAKIRRVTSLYRALGSHPDKLKFKDEVAVLVKLYNCVMSRVKGYRVPRSFWDELLNMVHEKSVIPEIRPLGEVTVDPELIEEITESISKLDYKGLATAYTTADILSSIRGIIESEPANPVYKHIYERLKRLEEQWASRVDPQLVNEVKNLWNEMRSYLEKRRSMELEDRILFDIKEYLSKVCGRQVLNLTLLESTIAKIIPKYLSGNQLPRLLEIDKKNIKVAIKKDLFNLKLAGTQKAEDIANEVVEYIERALLNELRRYH